MNHQSVKGKGKQHSRQAGIHQKGEEPRKIKKGETSGWKEMDKEREKERK